MGFKDYLIQKYFQGHNGQEPWIPITYFWSEIGLFENSFQGLEWIFNTRSRGFKINLFLKDLIAGM